MHYPVSYRSVLAAVAVVLAGLSAWPTAGSAQLDLLSTASTTVSGQARAVQATVLGSTMALADTGTLGGTSDVREASQVVGSIPSVVGGEVLRAITIGWPDQVASEASLASLGLTVAGTSIWADFAMARALSVLGGGGTGDASVTGLQINGIPIYVTGAPNQTVAIPGGQVVINEQQTSLGGTTVNALHVIVYGVTDVVIASATAGIY